MYDKKKTFETYREDATIYYSQYTCACGEVVVLTTEKGICGLHFLDKPLSYYLHLAERKFGVLPIYAPSYTHYWWESLYLTSETLSLVLRGTLFQQKVWQTLCNIPVGTTRSYQALAIQSGFAQCVRAVANAISQNFIAWLVPCHRVVRKDGQIGGYRWGVHNKVALLELEKASYAF
mmetsp:Transcript_10273/g.23728  ORF Transcript_10273/g.23728 Transcript_10273/m.23728 type:complete len:177 (-) Transcript_10273:1057-1587(-)